MKQQKEPFFERDATKKVLSSLISILIGLVVGAIVVLIVGLTNSKISVKGAWEGVRLIFFGIFSTGRANGQLTWGFNAVSMSPWHSRRACSTSAPPASTSWARW